MERLGELERLLLAQREAIRRAPADRAVLERVLRELFAALATLTVFLNQDADGAASGESRTALQRELRGLRADLTERIQRGRAASDVQLQTDLMDATRSALYILRVLRTERSHPTTGGSARVSDTEGDDGTPPDFHAMG